jgi:hypothetical protein
VSWDEDSAAQWAAQELCERRRFEEEQEALRADPAFCEWLEYIAACAAFEPNEQELSYGDHG